MGTKQEDFRFDHRKNKTKAINVKMLDALMEDCIAAGTSKWASIVMACKIVLFACYIFARRSLLKEEFMVAQQEYQQGSVNENQEDIDDDELD